MRYLFFIIILIMVLGGARLGFCDWEEMIQVNTNNSDKQASRDSDCPWPIAADDSGNVYTVWEDLQFCRSGSESVEDGEETRHLLCNRSSLILKSITNK